MVFSLEKTQLTYGKLQVLHNLQLEIKSGEKVAIIGESGAGKSTLLKALRGQQAKLSAWCPQEPGLVPMLNSLHNIYMGQLDQHHFLVNLKRLIYPGSAIKKEISRIGQKLSLETQLYQAAEQLSGGQQQRVSIGRAIYSNSPIFLGDEPVSALDEYQSKEILQLICDHFETLVITLHDVDLAVSYCQRIIALKDGQILFDKPSKDLTTADLAQVYQ